EARGRAQLVDQPLTERVVDVGDERLAAGRDDAPDRCRTESGGTAGDQNHVVRDLHEEPPGKTSGSHYSTGADARAFATIPSLLACLFGRCDAHRLTCAKTACRPPRSKRTRRANGHARCERRRWMVSCSTGARWC